MSEWFDVALMPGLKELADASCHRGMPLLHDRLRDGMEIASVKEEVQEDWVEGVWCLACDNQESCERPEHRKLLLSGRVVDGGWMVEYRESLVEPTREILHVLSVCSHGRPEDLALHPCAK